MKIDGNLPIAKFDAAHAEGIAPEVVIASLRRLKSSEQAEPWGDRPLADLPHHLAHLHDHIFLENCILFPRAAALLEQAMAPAAPSHALP